MWKKKLEIGKLCTIHRRLAANNNWQLAILVDSASSRCVQPSIVIEGFTPVRSSRVFYCQETPCDVSYRQSYRSMFRSIEIELWANWLRVYRWGHCTVGSCGKMPLRIIGKVEKYLQMSLRAVMLLMYGLTLKWHHLERDDSSWKKVIEENRVHFYYIFIASRIAGVFEKDNLLK